MFSRCKTTLFCVYGGGEVKIEIQRYTLKIICLKGNTPLRGS
jgi:hypothetical protein